MIRGGWEYAMAIRLVQYQEALNKANQCLANSGRFGIIPSSSVSFREGRSFYKRVNDTIKKFKEGTNGQ